jgi:hypothetical protein
MSRSKPIPEGSRIFLSKAGEYAVKPTNGLGRSHNSCCLEGGFPDQIDRVTVVLDAAPSSRGEGKRFASPLPRLYDFAHSKSWTCDWKKSGMPAYVIEEGNTEGLFCSRLRCWD